MEALKISLLQELFASLMRETHEKQMILENVRNGALRETLTREKVPLDAAWDVLDKLTNDQLKRAAKKPVEMYSRVEFNITLSMCSENMLDTIKKTVKDHEHEKKERKRINNFLKFHLREYLDQDPDLDWHEIHSMLNTMPLVELNRLTENPDKVVQMAKQQKADGDTDTRKVPVFQDNVLTVEDLNSMVMFLQKLPYDELHQIIEFTQLLVDFLTLPSHAPWRDAVVSRGRREAEAQNFYKGMFDLRQQLDKAEQQDAKEEARLAALAEQSPEKKVMDERPALDEVAEILDNPPEVEAQLHRFLVEESHHKNHEMSPEKALQNIIGDHGAHHEDDGSEGGSDVTIESVDSAIAIPNPLGEEDGGDPMDPLWKKISELRVKAADVLQNTSNASASPLALKDLHGSSSSSGSNAANAARPPGRAPKTTCSLDELEELDEDLVKYEAALREMSKEFTNRESTRSTI